VNDFKKKLKQQTRMFTEVAKVQTCSLAASYTTLELAKSKKPFSDGSLVENCAIEMAKTFGDSSMVEKFETVSLSHQTMARRVAHMDEHVRSRLRNVTDKSVYISCLDDSTDQTDVSQLLIFVLVIQSDFSTHEELLNLVSLHGTTKGSDIF
jgi:hypothetical protein